MNRCKLFMVSIFFTLISCQHLFADCADELEVKQSCAEKEFCFKTDPVPWKGKRALPIMLRLEAIEAEISTLKERLAKANARISALEAILIRSDYLNREEIEKEMHHLMRTD